MDGIACTLTFEHVVMHEYSTRDAEVGVALKVLVVSSARQQRRQVLQHVRSALEREKLPWFSAIGERWHIDATLMKKSFPSLSRHEWLTGRLIVTPDHEPTERTVFGEILFEHFAVAYITPDSMGEISMPLPPGYPPSISESIKQFRLEHPDSAKTAFIMMRFGSTPAHLAIVTAIRESLSPHGISALRADDKEYHEDLLPNILTYIYGCAIGIAVFERLETDDFNPNVALEVGYMLAMQKPVCLLKDRTLKALHTDLVGKLYRPFDPQKASEEISAQLTVWLKDKGIAPATAS